MFIPIAYYIFIPLWLTKVWMTRVQFWAGLCLFVLCGPFINIAVLLYASFYMDSFGWGKTRKVITETESGEKTETELQRLEKGDLAPSSNASTTSTEGFKPVYPRATDNSTRKTTDEESGVGR